MRRWRIAPPEHTAGAIGGLVFAVLITAGIHKLIELPMSWTAFFAVMVTWFFFWFFHRIEEE